MAEALAKSLAAAGAERVEGSTKGIILTHRPDGEPEPCLIQVLAAAAERAASLTIRVRPDHLQQTNILPPRGVHDVILEFLETYHARVDGECINFAPHILAGQEAALEFCDFLAGPRPIPVVVVTPGPHSDADSLADLARHLAGFATVWSLDALAAQTVVMTLGKERGVYGGAVRIYRPGFTLDADPLDHDLMIGSYLERRLTNGRTLADEIARRILPEAGEPIPIPKLVTQPRNIPVLDSPRALTSQEQIEELERELAREHEEVEDVREEVRHLNATLREAKEELKRLRGAARQPAVPTTQVPDLPWPLENPKRHPVELGERFSDQLQRVARDGSLAADVRTKMEAILEAPTTYGKEMRGARKGQRACYVANNYRLVWSVSGRTVRFVLVVSKEDPEYSPHGA